MDGRSWRAIAILKAKSGKEQELTDYTLEVMPMIRLVDGLLKVEVNRTAFDPGQLVLYYWWESLEHSDLYVAGPIYAKVMPKLKELIQEHTLILGELIDG